MFFRPAAVAVHNNRNMSGKAVFHRRLFYTIMLNKGRELLAAAGLI